jgi:hypothetical protein
MWRNLIHLVHVKKKNLLCEVVPSFFYICLALLELLFWDYFFKLLQGDHSYALDAKNLMEFTWSSSMDLHNNKDIKNKPYP